MRVPNEAGVEIECSRCDETVIGWLNIEPRDGGGVNLASRGFVILMSPHIAPLFRPGEVVLCQRCIEAKPEKPVTPKIVVPEEI